MDQATINLCMDKQYTVEDIRKEKVVFVSIVWNEETISSIKVYSLSLKQTTNNWETYHTKDGCRRKIKSNLSLMYII